MNHNNDIEAKLDLIRDDISREMEGMSFAERSEYLRKKTDPVIKEFGMKTAKNAVGSSIAEQSKYRHF